MNNQSSDQMERVAQGFMQACDDWQATCRNSMDAAMEATSALTKGYEEFSRNFGHLMQESMARALSASKDAMSARSMKEISDLHAEFMKDAFDQWVSATGRLSEISARTTQEAFEPVARHASDAMSKAAQKAQETTREAGRERAAN